MTNGRTRRTIRFWLESNIKRLYYKPTKHSEEERKECLSELFQECLPHQIQHGKNTKW